MVRANRRVATLSLKEFVLVAYLYDRRNWSGILLVLRRSISAMREPGPGVLAVDGQQRGAQGVEQFIEGARLARPARLA